ncbi:MAG: efflux RND transporter periplasmic adaptor subunit [Rhodobacteraceae bacterium]|nr:efflux RND transporter periplasmic adaptor subunit [Paracoccaceae bacterium]
MATASMESMTATTSFSGRLVAASRVELRARVSGYLEEVAFREGAEVALGDTLFVIEDDLYQANVAQIEGQISAAEAELKLAELERERTARLVERGTLAQADLDRNEAAVGRAEGSLATLRAQLDQANIELSYTQVTAPFDGITGLSTFDPGAFLSPESGILVTLTALDPMFVEFAIPTAVFLRLRADAPVGAVEEVRVAEIKIRLPDGTVYDEVGQANFINPEVDQGTDTILIRAVFDNPDYVLPDSGLVQVLISELDPEQRLAIPAQAISRDLAGPFVMVVDANSTVEQRRIDTGISALGLTEVVSGLEAGENVITEGINKVRPGIQVDAAVAGG